MLTGLVFVIRQVTHLGHNIMLLFFLYTDSASDSSVEEMLNSRVEWIEKGQTSNSSYRRKEIPSHPIAIVLDLASGDSLLHS